MLKSLFGKNKNIEGKVKDNDVAHYRLNAKDNNSENKLLNYYNAIIFKAKEKYKENKYDDSYLAVTYGNDERMLNLILHKLNQKLNFDSNDITFIEGKANICVVCFNNHLILPIPERMSDFNFRTRELFVESLVNFLLKNGIEGFYRFEDSIFYKFHK